MTAIGSASLWTAAKGCGGLALLEEENGYGWADVPSRASER